MNITTRLILGAIFGYLIGSFSFAIFVSKKLSGDDIRKYGSGNAGAANMTRTMGIQAGLMTLAGDALKGSLAAFIGLTLAGPLGAALGGIAVYLGHCLPLYHNFKGGKGVATAAGVFLIIDGNVFLFFLLIWASTIAFTRLVGLGAVVAAWSYPFGVVLFTIYPAFQSVDALMASPSKLYYLAYLLLGLLFAVAITFYHRGNLARIVKGTEPRLDFERHEKEEKYD